MMLDLSQLITVLLIILIILAIVALIEILRLLSQVKKLLLRVELLTDMKSWLTCGKKLVALFNK